jgi:hypothetical protein
MCLTRMVYLLWVFQRRTIEAELDASKESNGKASAQAAEILVNQVPEVEAKGMDLLLYSGDLNICLLQWQTPLACFMITS